MLSHLGRHSTEQFGATRSVVHLQDTYGTNPIDILVWMSPSPNGDAYPLWAFDDRSFKDVLFEQFCAAGVPKSSIEVSEIDTITDPEYFSHSEFLKGNRPTDGRYAIAAVLR
jgi:copper oxidase (laccase) domain-containing protein